MKLKNYQNTLGNYKHKLDVVVPKANTNFVDYSQNENDLETKLETLKQNNIELSNQLSQMGVSEKDIEKVNDNRSWFKKLLNLKENQGIFTGTLELLNRPAEALQGMLAATTTGENILDAAWKGLHGDIDYTLKDTFGIDTNSPFTNAILNMGFEMLIDPFNFINEPFKLVAEGGKQLLTKGLAKLETLSTRSSDMKQLFEATRDLTNTTIDWFKRTFGTWKEGAYKNANNDLSNLVHNVKENNIQAQEQLLNLSNQVDDFASKWYDSIVKGSDGFNDRVIQETFEVLDLDINLLKDMRQGDDALKLASKETFKESVNKYLGRVIESNYTQGKDIGSVLSSLLDEEKGYSEIFDYQDLWKDEEAVKNSELYKVLDDFVRNNLDIEPKNVFTIERVDTSPISIGGVLKDSFGKDIVQKSKQGWKVRLSDEILDNPKAFNKLNSSIKNVLKSRDIFRTKMISTKGQFANVLNTMNELNTKGFIEYNPNNSQVVDAISAYEELYSALNKGAKLEFVRTPLDNGWVKLTFAPNKQVAKRLNSLNSQILNLQQNTKKIKSKLAKYNELTNKKQQLSSLMDQAKDVILKQAYNNPELLFPTNSIKAQELLDLLTNDIVIPYDELLEKAYQGPTINPSSIPNEENFKMCKRGVSGLISQLNLKNNKIIKNLSEKGIIIDTTKIVNKTSGVSIPFRFDISNMSDVERLNIVSYLIDKHIITINDVVNSGIKSLQDITKLSNEKFNSLLESINGGVFSIDLVANPNSVNSTFIINSYLVEDKFLAPQDVYDIINGFATNIKSGIMGNYNTFEGLVKTLMDETTIQWLKTNNNLSPTGQKLFEELDKAQQEIKKINKAIGAWCSKNNLAQLQVLDNAYTNGIYSYNIETRVGRLLDNAKKDTKLAPHIGEYLDEIYTNSVEKFNILDNGVEQLNRTIDRLSNSLASQYQTKYKDVLMFDIKRQLNSQDLKLLKSNSNSIWATSNGESIMFSTQQVPNSIKLDSDFVNDWVKYTDAKNNVVKLNKEKDNIRYTIEEAQIAIEMNKGDFVYSLDNLKDRYNVEAKAASDDVANGIFANININTNGSFIKKMLNEKTQALNEVSKLIDNNQRELAQANTLLDMSKLKAKQELQIKKKQLEQEVFDIEKDIKTQREHINSLKKAITTNRPQGMTNKMLLDNNETYQESLKKIDEFKQKRLDTIAQKKSLTIDDSKIKAQEDTINNIQKELDELKAKRDNLQKEVNDLDIGSKNAFTNVETFNELDDLIANVDSENYTPISSLAEADRLDIDNYYKNKLDSVKYVNQMLSLKKVDFNDANAVVQNQLLVQLPEQIKNSLLDLANKQMAIQGTIGRTFNEVFGIDMTNWDVAGYLRHIVNVDTAQIIAATNALEGRYALSGNKLFGKNLKKIAQYREFKGASYDVNKTFGTEIFNTDPIVATAVALELAPQSFSLGGVFKNMIDTGVIKRVEGFNSNNFNNKAIDEVIDFYTKKKEVILRDTNINAYQQKELNEINEVLVKANEFQEVRKQMDANVANEINISNTNQMVEDNVKKIEQQIQDLKNQREYVSFESNDLEMIDNQIKELQETLKNEKAKFNKVELNDKQLEIKASLENQLVELNKFLTPYITKTFKGSNKWLGGIDGIANSNEYEIITQEILANIKSNFDGFKEAAFDLKDPETYKKIADNEWITQLDSMVDEINNGQVYVIHKGMLEHLKRYAKTTKSSASILFRTLQKYITVPWKKLSLLSVGFHARNIFSNYVNVYLAGINPSDFHKGMNIARKELKVFEEFMSDIATKLQSGKYRSAQEQIQMINDLITNSGEKGKIFADYMEMCSRGIIGNNQFSNDAMDLFKKLKNSAYGIDNMFNNNWAKKGFIGFSKSKIEDIMSKSFKLSKHLDDYAKVSIYRLIKNEPKYIELAKRMGFNGENAAERFTKFVLFDYNDLTYAEETYMKALFPFYTWMRKNLEFQLRNFAKNTKQYMKLYNALQGWRQGMIGDSDNETQIYEDYIPIWNDDGVITYVKFSPSYDEVDDVLSGVGILNSLSPIIKTPLEMISGYDFFTGRDLNTNGIGIGFGLGLNNLVGTMNTIWKMIFQNYTPTYEEKKLGGVIGKKLIDTIEVMKNVLAFPTNARDEGMMNSIFKLFPSVFSQNEILTSQYYNALERNHQLQEAIKKYGV